MDDPTRSREVRLAHRAIYSIPDAAGLQIQCREGTLWLTLAGDPRDIVLEAGETFVTGEHRDAIVYALQASRFEVTARTPAARGTLRSGLQIESAPLLSHV